MPQFNRLAVALLLLLAASPLAAKGEEQDPWLMFVTGRFTLIGRLPEGGATYAGEATIEARGKGLVLHRKVDGKKIEATGSIEVPSPPGEGKVLRFRWKEGDARWLISCLVSTDLDNYARLSCVWGDEGKDYKMPGLESYFSSEVWADQE